MAKISTSANRRTMSRFGGDETAGGGGGGGTPGEIVLSGCVLWLDTTDYSGSGDMVNKGTAGAALNGILGGGGAAPTWTAGSPGYFTFDGVNDLITVANNSALNFADADDWTLGAIWEHASAPANNARWVDKFSAGLEGYAMRYQSSSVNTIVTDSGGHAIAATGTGAVPTATKMLLLTTVNKSGGNTARVRYNTTLGTSLSAAPLTSATTNTDPFEISSSTNPIAGKFYGVFLARSILTSTNITDVGTYYGVSA